MMTTRDIARLDQLLGMAKVSQAMRKAVLDVAMETARIVCSKAGCGVRFIPSGRQRYCSKAHSYAARAARFYQKQTVQKRVP
jgi:hypothetical protein